MTVCSVPSVCWKGWRYLSSVESSKAGCYVRTSMLASGCGVDLRSDLWAYWRILCILPYLTHRIVTSI